ncbi:MAG TPA: hypothetical protein VLT33_17445, partial [Labilithrix sp.]|nr:hypothetical protein [Labilithrix sp.]
MVRSLRHFAKLGALLPLVLFAVACGDDESSGGPDASTTKEAGTGIDGGGGADGATDGGADGATDGGADGALPDNSAPTVVSTSPAPAATGAA